MLATWPGDSVLVSFVNLPSSQKKNMQAIYGLTFVDLSSFWKIQCMASSCRGSGNESRGTTKTH